jgi:hypothetical protein
MLHNAKYGDIVGVVSIIESSSDLYASCDSVTQGFRHIGMGVSLQGTLDVESTGE